MNCGISEFVETIPANLSDSSVDVLVVGSTPSGIAAAVRAAREGRTVLLASVGEQVGGMVAGGLSYTDTMTMKARCAFLEEYVASVRATYAERYGGASPEYAACENGYICEPHVARMIFEKMLAAEKSLTVVRGWRIVSAERFGRRIVAARFESTKGEGILRVAAKAFIDCTYEGDLMAATGTAYRVGKESREEFGEQFAGKLHVYGDNSQYYPREAVSGADRRVKPKSRGPLDVPEEKRHGQLDIIPHPAGMTEIGAWSTGEGDDSIQAYNYRICLTSDKANSVAVAEPADYSRENYLDVLERILEAERKGLNPLPGPDSHLLNLRHIPNRKVDMNGADMPGCNWDYPDADWQRREQIAKMHKQYALGLIYFLQNDPQVPANFQAEARRWALPKDEFVDNGHFPHELYVREARRLSGRYIFREQDARYAAGLHRSPIHYDSVAIAEYPMDSHASGTGGGYYASEITRPSQIPYRSLLPVDVDNLLVPVCLSATHASFGTVRVEPTWMHIGESAGLAASLAVKENLAPALLDPAQLQLELLERGIMVTFFNGFDMATQEPWVKAVQFLGTRGFFPSYSAGVDAPLSRAEAETWVNLFAAHLQKQTDINGLARAVLAASKADSEPIGRSDFVDALRRHEQYLTGQAVASFTGQADAPLSRAEAACIVFDSLRVLFG